MSNSYQYKISDMQRDNSGIVKTVVFSITVSDETDSYTHNYFTGLPAPQDTPIPYENLTESQVITWVKDLVGAQSEESADGELAAYKIRKDEVKTNGLPWQ
jgi:hypothetical protein